MIKMKKFNEVKKAVELLIKFCNQKISSYDCDTNGGDVCQGCPFRDNSFDGWCMINSPKKWDLKNLEEE